MRKIKHHRKITEGPTLRESWWLIPVAVAIVALIVILLWQGFIRPAVEPVTEGWPIVANRAAPVVPTLPSPRHVLEPTRFSLSGDPDAERYARRGARYLAQYDVGTPPVPVEVIYFLQQRAATEAIGALPGFSPVSPAISGEESAANAATGETAFRRGRIVVRLKAAGPAAASVAQEVDEALTDAFGPKP